MPNLLRPDLLPFARPIRLGLPYHGLVTDGVLALPDSTTLGYTQPDNGDTVLVRHPLATAPTPDPEHPKYSWQNYAVLSGVAHKIGGISLSAEKWIYCDSRHSWLMGLEWSQFGSVLTVTVYCYAPFGLLKDDQITYTKRSLASTTITLTDEDGDPITAPVDNAYHSTHSETGAVSAYNWFIDDYSHYTADIVASMSITLTGDGNVDSASAGVGIMATIADKATVADMWTRNDETTYTDTDTVWQTNGCTESDPAGSLLPTTTTHVVEGLVDTWTMTIDASPPPTGQRGVTATKEVSCCLYTTKAGILGNAISLEINDAFHHEWQTVMSPEPQTVTVDYTDPEGAVVTEDSTGTLTITKTNYNLREMTGTVFGLPFSYTLGYTPVVQTSVISYVANLYSGIAISTCTLDETGGDRISQLGGIVLGQAACGWIASAAEVDIGFDVHTNGVIDIYHRCYPSGVFSGEKYRTTMTIGGAEIVRSGNATVQPDTLAVTQSSGPTVDVCYV